MQLLLCFRSLFRYASKCRASTRHTAADVKRIVDTRNEVIHTGLFGNVHNDDTYEFLETTLREYFLRLVGYQGPFLTYQGGSATRVII